MKSAGEHSPLSRVAETEREQDRAPAKGSRERMEWEFQQLKKNKKGQGAK